MVRYCRQKTIKERRNNEQSFIRKQSASFRAVGVARHYCKLRYEKSSETSYDELMAKLLDRMTGFYKELERNTVSLQKLKPYGDRAKIYTEQLRKDLDEAAMVIVRQIIKQLPREKLWGCTQWEVIQAVRPVLRKRMEVLSNLLSASTLQMKNYMLLWDYQDAGFTHYRLLTEGENCDDCNSLEGQVFPISEARVGEKFPPMHPNCNCRVGVLDHAGRIAYIISDGQSEKNEEETNWYDAFLRMPQDVKELFLAFVRAQNERFYRGDIAGFLDWLTLGLVSGTWQGHKDRSQELLQDPTLYNIANYLTFGFADTVKGAIKPEEPLSLQHWLDVLGVVSTAFGAYQMVKSSGSSYKTGAKVTRFTDDIEEGLEQTQKINSSDIAQKGTSKIPWDSWQNYEKVTQNGQVYAKVGNRLYSEHAVNRMQPSGNRFGPNITQGYGTDYGRSIAPQYVEDIINSTKGIFQPETGNYVHHFGTVKVVVNQQGAVVTIITYQ